MNNRCDCCNREDVQFFGIGVRAYCKACHQHITRTLNAVPVTDFGFAIRALKEGNRVTRAGWNGKGMWLVLIQPGNACHRSTAGTFPMIPCIGLKTAQEDMQPGWIASQGDMLAEDWQVLS